jgi:probable phosphoglycerate mutase
VTGRIPTRVLLVRHGQSTWNADGRWQGQADPPLSALGEQQAREAAARLRDVDALWASDLDRARRTATILGDALGLGVRVDARLRERHAGPWQGLTREQIEAEWPGHLTTNRRPADYETNTTKYTGWAGLYGPFQEESLLLAQSRLK